MRFRLTRRIQIHLKNMASDFEREEMLRRALEEQMARATNAEHAAPIERLMDRLSAGEKLKDEEYAAISEEIKRIQARNADHLTRLEDLLDAKVAK